jgi:hypothetical protein
MTDEERLDRLERIMKLVVRAGLRERRDTRDKIDALNDAHVRTEEAMARMADAQRSMADAQKNMADAQAHTDKRLDALIDIVREGRNGKADS